MREKIASSIEEKAINLRLLDFAFKRLIEDSEFLNRLESDPKVMRKLKEDAVVGMI